VAPSGPHQTLPRVGISACLLGERVRYDGGHKFEASLAGLSGRVEWVAVCPEIELGLPTPRPPVRLENRAIDSSAARERRTARAGAGYEPPPGSQISIRLRVAESGEDLTAAMTGYAEERIQGLLEAGMSGYVLKSRSPSCGLDVEVAVASEKAGRVAGVSSGGRHPGLFAAALLRLAPQLPIVEEDRLRDVGELETFLERVRECHQRAHHGGR
jgi:uncharacterized protein YbbK (DUF523 family)